MTKEVLLPHFPKLTNCQIDQFDRLQFLYEEWNAKINVISRKDIDNLYVRHVLHSLSIAKFISFLPAASILDLGTGGGFPGIPLAILMPEVSFTLIDGTQKKIRVVSDIIETIGLKNATALAVRAEEYKQKHDFVIARAVTSLDQLFRWSQRLIKNKQLHAMPNGLLALKGGAIDREVKAIAKGNYIEIKKLESYFPGLGFDKKYIVYVQV